MLVTIEIDPVRRTAAFREVSFLAAGDSCRVVLDGVRGADFGSLALLLYRDAASESPVASCSPFSPVAGHPALADGALALDTAEMAAWFADAVPEEPDDSDDDDPLPRASASAEPRLAARASLAERSVRADGWLVVLDRDRTWAACRVPVLLRPGAAGHGAYDPTSVRALVEGLVSAVLADKADKAVPSAQGNLASLDASGNLADSGKSPSDFAPASHASDGSVHHTASEIGQIAAAKVAEVVADAPANLDTLKEIADVIGTESGQAAGGILKRVSDLERGKADSSSLAAVATSGFYDDLSGKPTIPAAVTVDSELSGTSANPVQNRAVKAALDRRRGLADLAVYSAADEWECTAGSASYRLLLVQRPSAGVALWASGEDPSSSVMLARYPNSWVLTPAGGDGHAMYDEDTGWGADARDLEFDIGGVAWSLVYVDASPTGESLAKVSQTPTPEQVGYINAVPGKADKAVPSAAGNLAALDAQGNLADSGVKASDFAAKADLPYALVEPGKWEFSGISLDEYDVSDPVFRIIDGKWELQYVSRESGIEYSTEVVGQANDLSVVFNGVDGPITATRPSLPGHLLDRAVNAVSVIVATTLTLPAANPGRMRDLYVRLSVSSTSAVTWTIAQGESWDAMGAPPVSFAAGTYLYRVTEVAPGVWHAEDMMALVGLEAALAAINGGVAA